MAPRSMKYNPAFLDDEALIQSFVARTAELQTILDVVRENTAGSNQHLLVIGARGLGKTTLVLRVAAQIRTEPVLGDRWHPIVFGEETYQAGTPGEFWLEALFHLGQQTRDSRWLDAYEELRLETHEDRLRRRALAQLLDFADEQSKRLMLVVENLNMLVGAQISGDDAWVLRHTLMNEPRLMLLGTATSRFKEVDEYNQALYELFRIIELEPLNQMEAQALWTAITGQSTTARLIRPLQILTGGNPRLIRILSEFAAHTSFRSLMDNLTRLVDEHTEYFKHHLDSLPPQERKVFVALADLWDPATARKVAEVARLDVNIASALLKRLAERGAVSVAYKRGRAQYYQVAERMYNIYHLMRRRGPTATRVHAVVRFMVSLYRDNELVRTTRLLVEEASRLARDQRREHFLAYEAILQHARKPRLTQRLIEATRFAFEAMPDIPESLQKLIGVPRSRSSVQVAAPQEPHLPDLLVEEVEDKETLLQLAAFLSEQAERSDDAEAAFRKALAKDPNDPLTWDQFGVFLGRQRRLNEQALDQFDRAIALNDKYVVAWLHRSAALDNLGRIEEALKSIDHALSLDAEIAPAWFARGNILDRLGRLEEAVASYDRGLQIDPQDAVAWSMKASLLEQLVRPEEALESTDRALSLDPDDASAWSTRGDVLIDLGRREEAIESYDRALALDPDFAMDWLGRGRVLYLLGRHGEALDSIERALALDGENAWAWSLRGDVLDRLEDLKAAEQSYARASALEPEYGYAWVMRGSMLDDLGHFHEALECLDRALALESQDAFAWGVRGDVLASLEQLEDAIESYSRALSIDPEDWYVLSSRGRTFRQLQRFREAESDFRQVLFLDDEPLHAGWELLELYLMDLKNRQEALSVAQDILSRNGTSAETCNDIAWLFYKYGQSEDFREAESWARNAVELEPENGDSRHTLACLLGAQHRWADALDQAASFLKDQELLSEKLDEVIDFFIDAVAVGHGEEVMRTVQASGTTGVLEPLVVAIRRLSGEEVDIATEILEVANDVMKRIESRRREIRQN